MRRFYDLYPTLNEVSLLGLQSQVYLAQTFKVFRT